MLFTPHLDYLQNHSKPTYLSNRFSPLWKASFSFTFDFSSFALLFIHRPLAPVTKSTSSLKSCSPRPWQRPWESHCLICTGPSLPGGYLDYFRWWALLGEPPPPKACFLPLSSSYPSLLRLLLKFLSICWFNTLWFLAHFASRSLPFCVQVPKQLFSGQSW